MTYLFLIRHGETPWTKKRRFQGSADILLTPRGKRQAKAVGHCLKRYGVDAIYCSPLRRAYQTAKIISKIIRLKPQLDPRLKELRFGIWEGKTAAELLKDKTSGYHKWCQGKKVTPKKGETLPHFRKRVTSFLKQISQRHSGKKIAVVTHGGPVKICVYEALKMPLRSLWSFRIETASITVIGLGKHFAQIFCLNDTSHLPHHLTVRPEYVS